VEEALTATLRIFGLFITEGILAEYWELLADEPPALICQACKEWLRQPTENRHPYPHELKVLVAKLRPPAPCPGPTPEEATRHQRSPEQLDRIFLELAEANPDKPFIQEIVADRARRRLAGQDPETAGREIALGAFHARLKTR